MSDKPLHQRQENRDENVSSENQHSQSTREHTNAAMSEESSLSPSVIFGLLADERRRYVLYYLDAHDGQAEFTALAKHVAARENDTSVELLTEDVTDPVSTRLYHADLPKLADHGLIEDEFQQGTITLTETAAQVAHYVDFARQFDDNTAVDGSNQARSGTDGTNDD